MYKQKYIKYKKKYLLLTRHTGGAVYGIIPKENDIGISQINLSESENPENWKTYYFNKITNEIKTSEFNLSESENPKNWKTYYFNKITNESRWEKPRPNLMLLNFSFGDTFYTRRYLDTVSIQEIVNEMNLILHIDITFIWDLEYPYDLIFDKFSQNDYSLILKNSILRSIP